MTTEFDDVDMPRPLLVIDTNIIRSDPNFGSAQWQGLVAAVEAEEVDVAVPEVVVRESARHMEQRIKSARRELNTAVRAIHDQLRSSRLDAPALTYLPSVAELRKLPEITTEELRSELRNRFKELGFTVAPIPEAAHDQLVDWSLASHRPFDATDKGYRDALIWHTFCDLAAADSAGFVVLVSDDNDYCARGKTTPHEDLAGHLASIGRTESVGFARTVLEGLEVARAAMTNTSWWPRVPSPRVTDLLMAAIRDAYTDMIGAPLTRDVYDDSTESLLPGVELPEELEAASISTARFEGESAVVSVVETYRGRTSVGTVEVRTSFGYEALMDKGEFYSTLDNDAVWTLVDPDYNRNYVAIEGEFGAVVEFAFVIDHQHENVMALDIEHVQLL